MAKKPEQPAGDRKRGSGVKLVYDVLRNEIISLTLPPGSPIDEIQLAERFAMSRTPIREALVRLAGDGLVTTLPNRSTVVSNIDFQNLPAFFDAITLMYRATTRLAALHRSAEDLVQIRTHQVGDTGAGTDTYKQAHIRLPRAGETPEIASDCPTGECEIGRASCRERV